MQNNLWGKRKRSLLAVVWQAEDGVPRRGRRNGVHLTEKAQARIGEIEMPAVESRAQLPAAVGTIGQFAGRQPHFQLFFRKFQKPPLPWHVGWEEIRQ